MTAHVLGEAAARALRSFAPAPARAPHRTPHRTGAPVRRDSVEAGSFEEMFFAVPAKGETDRMLGAARAALDAGRRLRRAHRADGRHLTATERSLAALTAGAVRVYEELLTLARLNRGRVYPSYDWLAEACALGRATIARALTLLEAAGLLVRQRRFVRVAEGGGAPRYRQTSNAYRAVLPARILGFLPRRFRPAPLPADVVQRGADRAADEDAMRAGLSCRDLARAVAGGALGKALAKLGAALDARESQDDPEPHSRVYESSADGAGLAGQHVLA